MKYNVSDYHNFLSFVISWRSQIEIGRGRKSVRKDGSEITIIDILEKDKIC